MNEKTQIQFFARKTDKDLLEIVEAYNIDKIKVGFRTFNLQAEQGSRLSNSVDFFMSIAEFDLLCHNLLSGNIMARLKSGEKIPAYYKGSARDGVLYARTLSITSSNKGIFITATEGPGEKTSTGAVKPKYKPNEASNRVSIALGVEEVKQFAIQGKRACDVYYMRMAGNVQSSNI